MPARLDELTPAEKRLLDFLAANQREGTVPPSTREIASALGYRSQTSVMQFRRSLERKGFIQPSGRKARSLLVRRLPGARSHSRSRLLSVPLLGHIAAGMPSDVSEQRGQTLQVDASALGLTSPNARPFALRARGDSMIGAMIQDGDYVVLDAARPPALGSIVAALIDGESTLKRYVIEKGRHFLRAENPRYRDLIPVQELTIQGVMVGLIRSLANPDAAAIAATA